jgi:DNA-binding response OmpR family regulator
VNKPLALRELVARARALLRLCSPRVDGRGMAEQKAS